MKQKIKYSKFMVSISCCIILCCLMLTACSSNDINKNNMSIAMIKNATMSTYGTGFAIGIPGKDVDTIVTSYSVVATPNGAMPKTAEVRINESEKKLSANVQYYDKSRNIAILKLAESSKELKPVILRNRVSYNETIYARGYDGTGNIMSDFEKFNTTDIVKYSGNISTYDELNTIVIYKYSNEFNRAMVGAPAMDKNGNVIGMCAYSQNSMNTYSQYILSSAEIESVLSAQKFDYVTSDEIKYKTIILSTIVFGLLVLVAIVVFTVVIGNKESGKRKGKEKADQKAEELNGIEEENNLIPKDKYIKITDGVLNGKIYKLDEKIVIGRDLSKCDIVYPIDTPGISAVHCTIKKEGNDYYLIDNSSTYGTFLENGMKITASVPYKIEKENFAFYMAEPKNRLEFITEEVKR